MFTKRQTLGIVSLILAVTMSALAGPVIGRTIGGDSASRAFGSASGTVVHADLLRSGDTKLEDTEVAFSGAAFDSSGLRTPMLNEMQRQFVPKLVGKTAFGQATGLEVGLAATPDRSNDVILAGKAATAAPPRVGAVTKEIGPVDRIP